MASRISWRSWRFWLRLGAFGLLALVVIFYIARPVILADQFTHPPRAPLNGASPRDVGLGYQDVTLTTSDGIRIAAWYVPGANGAAIVLVHGIGSNRAGMLPVAAMLARHGYGLLLIDMRAHGESGGDAWSSWLSERDVLAAVDYLKARPEVHRIGLMGFSAGATTVLHAAAHSQEVGAVAADAPAWTRVTDEPIALYSPRKLLVIPQDLVYQEAVDLLYLRGAGTPTGVIDDVPLISPRPLLLIAGQMNPNEVLFARNYYDHAGRPKQLWLLPDAGHGDKVALHPLEYEQHLADFFDGWITAR